MAVVAQVSSVIMSAQNQKLCEKCHQRKATNFICDGNTGESKQLCEACFQESASPEILAQTLQFQDAIRNGKCRYCGEPAVGGSGGFTDGLGKDLHLWCKQCSLDWEEFHSRPENDIPTTSYPFGDEEAIKKRLKEYSEREQREKEFMEQRISKRKSKGNS